MKPNHSRRSFIVGASAAAIVPTVATASDADAQLIAMADQIEALQLRVDAANEACDAAHDRYETMQPERPRALLWHIGDPATYDQYERLKEDGKTYLWCDLASIEKLRGKQFTQSVFIGTDEQWQALGEPTGGLKYPVIGHEHLFERWPDTRRQERAVELLDAKDRYSAAKKEALGASGYEAANNVLETLIGEMSDVFWQMMDIQPATIEGYRAQARALVVNCWCGSIDEGDTADERMLARMVANLTGLSIEAAA